MRRNPMPRFRLHILPPGQVVADEEGEDGGEEDLAEQGLEQGEHPGQGGDAWETCEAPRSVDSSSIDAGGTARPVGSVIAWVGNWG
jgi:hypothetical protein